MNKKGFTLIELLAVIVILAIIALIATPIVLNIIKDSKENAQLRSAEFYLDAVEYTIANSILDNNPMIDGIYDILQNGNICQEYDENKKCLNERNIELDGEKPKGGYVIIEKGQIIESRMAYEGNDVLYVEGKNSFISNYEIGDEVVYNAGDQDRTWNVISETEDTVTLMLNENIKDATGKNINWISLDDYNKYNELDDKQKECSDDGCTDSDEGPITAFISLNQLTNNWNNVDAIKDYTYINSDIEDSLTYKSIGIKDGITKIIDSEGYQNTLLDENDNPITTKARLITIEEILKITRILMPEFREVNILRRAQKSLDDQNIKDFTAKEYFENYAKQGGLPYDFVIIWICLNELDYVLPEFLFQNLYNNEIDEEYFLLSSLDYVPDNVFVASYDKILYLDTYPDSNRTSIRPVIEVSKDKLK